MAQGVGDRLARGAQKAAFMPAAGISDKKWSGIFDDFDKDRFLKTDMQKQNPGEKSLNTKRP
jgi:hypothetical protein